MYSIDFVIEGERLEVVGHTEAGLLTDSAGSNEVLHVLEVEAMAGEEPCEVEPRASGTRVTHATVVSLAAHSNWVVGGNSDGRDGFEGRRLRSMHAGEPVSEVVLSTRDVAYEEYEG